MRKPLIGKRELLGGLVAGSATVFGSTVILLLLGLIPSPPLRSFFGVWFQHYVPQWLSEAFTSPFWGLITRREVNSQMGGWTAHYSDAAASFGSLLVFVAVLCVVGFAVRRRVEDCQRRAGTLVVAALVVAFVVAIAAVALAWTHTFGPFPSSIGDPSPPETLKVSLTYSPVSYFFGALALTLLVGVFCFRLTGMLRQPWRAAVRRAGVFVGICFLVFGLLFPVFVVSDNLRGAKIFDDFGNASASSAAFGGLAIPLALQAPVSLTQYLSSPFYSAGAASASGYQSLGHWGRLSASMAFEYQRGLLAQYASSLGVVGSIVGAAISLAMVSALVLVTIGLCRSVGATTGRRGLEIGILQGASIACLLAVVLWLSTYYRSGGGMSDYWGVTVIGAAQTAVTLIVVCGLSGWLYGRKQARRDESLAGGRGTETPD
jgi:hypothetical protein